MTSSARMKCGECGTDITLSGSQICSVCDPDALAIINGQAKQKTPQLCFACFQKHVDNHSSSGSSESCPNCGFSGGGGVDPCLQCGHTIQVGPGGSDRIWGSDTPGPGSEEIPIL